MHTGGTRVVLSARLSAYELDRSQNRGSGSQSNCPRARYPTHCGHPQAASREVTLSAEASLKVTTVLAPVLTVWHQRPHGTSLTGRWLLLFCRATQSPKPSFRQCAGLQVLGAFYKGVEVFASRVVRPWLLRLLWRVGSTMRARLMENKSVMNLFPAVVSLHNELPKPPRDCFGAATMFSILRMGFSRLLTQSLLAALLTLHSVACSCRGSS